MMGGGLQNAASRFGFQSPYQQMGMMGNMMGRGGYQSPFGFQSPYQQMGMMGHPLGMLAGMGGMMGGMSPFGMMGGMGGMGGFQQPMLGQGGCPPWMPGCNGNFGGVYGGGGGGGGVGHVDMAKRFPVNEAAQMTQGGTSTNNGSWM
jgi:hypothetical protein